MAETLTPPIEQEETTVAPPRIQPKRSITLGTTRRRGRIGATERLIEAVGGAALALYGIFRPSKGGVFLAFAGGLSMYRALSGHAVDVKTGAYHIRKKVRINKPPEEVFQFWRNLENLPRFMRNLETVESIDELHSHWVAKGPGGTRIEWNAEIVKELPNRLICWRTTGDSDVATTGTVQFHPVGRGKETEVKVHLSFHPPGGRLSEPIFRFFGDKPGNRIQSDLMHFKEILESGQTPPPAEGLSPGNA